MAGEVGMGGILHQRRWGVGRRGAASRSASTLVVATGSGSTAPMAIDPAGGPAESGDLPRAFPDRAALEQALARWFPGATGPLSQERGGREAAEARLAALDPQAYGATRNHLDGAVTRLSPWIRHGVLSLVELRRAAIAAAERSREPSSPPRARGPAAGPGGLSGAGRLLQQLAWRDYWQRIWFVLGDGIHRDLEPLRTGHPPGSYAEHLPDDLAAAATGLACIDAFASELIATGWLHNHARLWLAAYLVHWRRVRWQAGARWFHSHLLDGDPASNSLSWQWVASSFSQKPYIFNRANLERFGAGHHCASCPAAVRGDATAPGGCPFDADYPWLQQRLFPALAAEPTAAPSGPPSATVPLASPPSGPAVIPAGSLRAPVLWIHAEALGPANPALRAYPGRPALAVLDPALLACPEAGPWSRKRLAFLVECLQALPLTIRRGDTLAELLAFAARHRADGVVTSRAVDPALRRTMAALAAQLPLMVLDPEPFIPEPFLLEDAGQPPPDLRRFSRYWRWAEPRLLRPAGRPGGGGP